MCDHDHVDLVDEKKGERCEACQRSPKPAMSHWDVACKDCGLLGKWCELADVFTWAAEEVVDAIPDAIEDVAEEIPEVVEILGNPLPTPDVSEAESEFMSRCMSWMHRTGEAESRFPAAGQPAAVCYSQFRRGRERSTRRNATCPTCGATDAYVSPFSGKLSCRVCDQVGQTSGSKLYDAFERAERALDVGDMAAFERHATEWAYLLYGSAAEGERAIADAARSEGSRVDGLRVMMYG